MSLIKPKTIIITGQPACHFGAMVTSPVVEWDSLIDDFDSEDDSTTGGTRKRKRLTFLSPEEKMVRRKLKNRVAAQTARDRKKQRMTELEEMIEVLQTQNQHLMTENEDLRRSAVTLLEENTLLKQRLEMPTNMVQVKPESEVVTRKLSDAVTESAVLFTPLQQEAARTSIQLAAYYLAWLTLLLMIRCLDSSKNSSMKMISSKISSDRQTSEKLLSVKSHSLRPPLEWWGRHQKNWNPLVN
jgi:X box-binding protein 1